MRNTRAPPAAAPVPAVPLRALAPALLGYTLFGVGYIGYMTFVVALLREQGMASGTVTLFYALLGLAVVLSSRIWAGLLDRSRGGRALALLNGLLGVATLLPALTSAWPVVLAGPAVWRGVPGGGGLDHRAGAPQPAARAVGRRHQRIHSSCSLPGRSWGPRWWAGLPTAPAGWRGLVYSACALWLGNCRAIRESIQLLKYYRL